MTAAMEQLEAAQGVKETPFATVRVSLAPAEEGGEATVAHFDAFQVRSGGGSRQVCDGVGENVTYIHTYIHTYVIRPPLPHLPPFLSFLTHR